MSDDAVGESMILEEDIDENYEPTEQEIIEYAKFLGMDTDKERDLFWIAREGLKAPLPTPWKPCQTKEGEIYYFHFESGQSQWEHPCDEYYKKMYDKEKKKKAEKTFSAKKETKETAAKGHTAKSPSNDMGIYSTGANPQSKLAQKKKEALSFATDVNKKANDPLIKAQQEKKLNNYKEKKEIELKERKQQLDEEIEERKQQLENEHKKAIKALEKKFEDLRAEEEERLRDEYKPLDEHEIPREKAKYTEQLKKEFEKDLESKLKKHQEALDAELDKLKQEYQNKKRDKIKEIHDKVGVKYQDTIEELELDISKLKASIQNEKSQDDSSAKIRESLRKSFMNEQETKFQLEKENIKNQMAQETRAMKQKEDEKYQEELNRLYQDFDKETKHNNNFDEDKYKLELESDLKTKVDQYRIQVNRKFEIMKLNSLEKLKDYEKQKLEEFRATMGNDLDYLEEELNKEKAKLEAQFQKDKLKAERKIEEDIIAYRDLSMKKLEDKKKLLDNEKLEKLNMLKIKLSTIKGVDEEDLKNTEATLSQMEEKMKNYQKTISSKNEEYKKELLTKERLLAEISELESKMNVGSSTQNGSNTAMDYETKSKIEQLNKVLKDKTQQLEALRHERGQNKAVETLHGSIIGGEGYEGNQNLGIYPETESFEIEKIHYDLEDIKKFIRGSGNKNDYDYKDDSDVDFRENYKNYYMPTDNHTRGGDVSTELHKDRRALEKKKSQLLRDLEMVNADRDKYRHDHEKQGFLRNVKKLIQQKLSRVNSQLDYLIKLSGRIERSTSMDKADRRSYIQKYNNYVEDTNSEALSEELDMN